MSECNDKERFIFERELARLDGECERCKDVRVKKEITNDLTLLKEAIGLLSLKDHTT